MKRLRLALLALGFCSAPGDSRRRAAPARGSASRRRRAGGEARRAPRRSWGRTDIRSRRRAPRRRSSSTRAWSCSSASTTRRRSAPSSGRASSTRRRRCRTGGWRLRLGLQLQRPGSAGGTAAEGARGGGQGARAVGVGPPNERAYIEALSVRYAADPAADKAQLARDYNAAMKALSSEKYPDDLDAATLYAEVGHEPATLEALDGRREAGGGHARDRRASSSRS